MPIIKQNDVVMNGPRAPQGDAFSKNVIVQSKYSVDYEVVECNLMDELYKSGLAKRTTTTSRMAERPYTLLRRLFCINNGTAKGSIKSKSRSSDTSRPQLPKTSRTLCILQVYWKLIE